MGIVIKTRGIFRLETGSASQVSVDDGPLLAWFVGSLVEKQAVVVGGHEVGRAAFNERRELAFFVQHRSARSSVKRVEVGHEDPRALFHLLVVYVGAVQEFEGNATEVCQGYDWRSQWGVTEGQQRLERRERFG